MKQEKDSSTLPLAGDDRPLSNSQQALLAATQLHNNSPAYNLSEILRITGDFDWEKFQQSLRWVILQNDCLRTKIVWCDGDAHQRISSQPELDITFTDTSELDESLDDVVSASAKFVDQSFDLDKLPLCRFHVWKRSNHEHVVAFVWHHLVFDNFSKALFFEQLFECYGGGIPDKSSSSRPQYSELAARHRAKIDGGEFDDQRQYWRQQLTSYPESLVLPSDKYSSSNLDQTGASEQFKISADQCHEIDQLCKQHAINRFDFLSAVLCVLLYRYSGQTEFGLGTFVNNRREGQDHACMGLFVNNLVLRQSLAKEWHFSDVLKSVSASNRDAFNNSDYPYDLLVKEFYRRQRSSENPWFEVLIDLHSDEFSDQHCLICSSNDFQVEILETGARSTKYVLSFDFYSKGNELILCLGYNTGVFLQHTVHWMGRHFLGVLEHCLKREEGDHNKYSIADLPVFTSLDRKRVFEDWNSTKVSHPAYSLHGQFEAAVDRYPDNIAVRGGQADISYRHLEVRANQLAKSLVAMGIKPNNIVGLCGHRSIHRMIALLAILKAGAAFLPLDPEDPEQRLEAMIDDAEPHLIIAEGEHLQNTDVPRISLNNVHLDNGESGERLNVELNPGDLAYLMYTSGSSGRPKGVMVSHTAINNQIAWMNREHPLECHDRVLQKTPYSFDVSVWEVFWPFAQGACLVLAMPGVHRVPEYLLNTIEKEKITIIHFVPSMLREFLNAYNVSERCKTLKAVYCSGEGVDSNLASQCYKELSLKLWNLYGPTEDAVHSTAWQYDPDDVRANNVPMGKPVDNTLALVLDAEMHLSPVGAIGELWLGGLGLANGYWQRAGLTAAIFKQNPFSDNRRERLYKTGDLVRYRSDGVLEYLGRVDNQVKLRGQRVELSEIEVHLIEHSSIESCLCDVVEYHNHDQRLVAWYVAAEELDVSVLQNWLRRLVPAAWVPSAFVRLEFLPLLPSGKLDRKALPEPDFSKPVESKKYVAPQTELENDLVETWQAILKVSKVGVNDNFFDLGGHSLLGVRLIQRVEQKIGRQLPINALQEISTIRDMADFIQDDANDNKSDSESDQDHRLNHSQSYRQMLAAVSSSTLPSVKTGSLILKANAEGTKKPLFWCFNSPRREMIPFCEQLSSDQPVYGMFSGGKILEPETQANIRWAIDKYVDEITRYDFEQPYVIGGNCRGAVVACGVALELIKRGHQVDRICLLEHFDSRLLQFTGKLMLLNGEDSHLQEYKKFNWREKGWQSQFKCQPVVDIIPGRHGFFFTETNIKHLTDRVIEFLEL